MDDYFATIVFLCPLSVFSPTGAVCFVANPPAASTGILLVTPFSCIHAAKLTTYFLLPIVGVTIYQFITYILTSLYPLHFL